MSVDSVSAHGSTAREGRLRRLLYRACLAVMGLLYVFSVPWYRSPEDPVRLWLGLPDWVATALLCYVAVAIVNAIAWSIAEVSDQAVGSAGDRSSIGHEPEEGAS